MNIKKWKQIYKEELDIGCDKILSLEITPNNWGDIKDALKTFIKEVDKATEVYNMENKEEKCN